MSYRQAQPSFAKGELGPELYARTDVQAYASAVKRAQNVRVRKYGGLAKRLGTRIVAPVYATNLANPVRLLPFQFNDQQTYVLEMGQGYMRIASGGGMLIEPALTITAITKAANAQVAVQYHGYSAGDSVFFSGIKGMIELNAQSAHVVSVIDANNFTINIDTTRYGTFTGSTGGVTNTSAPATATPAPAPAAPVVDPGDPDVTTPAHQPIGGKIP